ncbi:MAG: hypothetical protein IKO55_06370 [Kiritimatiellae bacterium]|nr:hypothetical protein [Kiritimatiellia bacterium]
MAKTRAGAAFVHDLDSTGVPSKVQQAFTKDFLKRIRRGEFESLERLDDDELRTIMQQASSAYSGVYPKDPDIAVKVDEAARINGVLANARTLLDKRQRDRQELANKQTSRQNTIRVFASKARELCELFAEVGFMPDIMAPETQPPLTADMSRALDYGELSTTADQAGWRVFLNSREIRRIDEAIAGIELFAGSNVLDVALDDLETRRAYLVRATSAHEATEAVARAEMQRRQLEAADRAKAEKSLPDTIKQLQEKIEELEKANAATA